MCVLRETETNRERVVLPLECAIECLFIIVLDAEEHQSSIRLLNSEFFLSAQLGTISQESLLCLPRWTDQTQLAFRDKMKSLSHKIKTR